MTVFNVLTLLGGLAFFLYGMNVMSNGLTKVSGSSLESSLRRLTSNQFKSIGLGLTITAVIQSSSALTVMLVGLVNSGIMTLHQSVGVIMGSNVGTTVTAWILSLSGIQGGNEFLNLLKPTSFSPVIAIIGAIMVISSKTDRKKEVGHILIGFAILMFGMDVMGGALKPLSENESFVQILTMFSNPFFGVITGAVFTGIIQSSSASVGILQALAGTGSITYGSALPIIMGQNIGTCVTALIASIGVTKNARRVAMVHILFNTIGTFIFLGFFYLLNALFTFSFLNEFATPVNVAVTHTAFNIFCTVIFLPFTLVLEKLANILVRDKKGEKEEHVLLDTRLLLNPSFAVEQSKAVTDEMANMVRESLFMSLGMLSMNNPYDEQKARKIEEYEDKIDKYEDKLVGYLVEISSKGLTLRDSRAVSMFLQNIGDFERIGDHSLNLLHSIQEINQKKIEFSVSAWNEINIVNTALKNIVNMAIDAFLTGDLNLALRVEPLEQVIDTLIFEMKSRHTVRLREGICKLETSFVYADLTNDLERISDHCSNIAVCLIEVDSGSYDSHEYLRNVKSSKNEFFNQAYEEYKKQYVLPQEIRD